MSHRELSKNGSPPHQIFMLDTQLYTHEMGIRILGTTWGFDVGRWHIWTSSHVI